MAGAWDLPLATTKNETSIIAAPYGSVSYKTGMAGAWYLLLAKTKNETPIIAAPYGSVSYKKSKKKPLPSNHLRTASQQPLP